MIKKFKPFLFFLFLLLSRQPVNGQAESDMASILTQKFNSFCEAVPREEVYLQSDRDVYISGEDLWFSAYVIDRKTASPSARSRIVYFELLNNANRPVIQRKILMNNGAGSGQISLPDTLSTGTYTIRAYTNWMKNFLPSNCYMKDISVYNTLSNNNFEKKHGKPKAGFNQSGIRDERITLDINNSDADDLTIIVNATGKFGDDNKNQIYLFIQTHGNIDHVSSAKLSGSKAAIRVSRSQLTAGINQITIFNALGIPVAEKYIYTPAIENKALNLEIPDSCSLRDRIDVDLKSVAGKGDLSVSVSPLNATGNLGMQDYMLLGSEFGIVKNLNFHNLSSQQQDSILSMVGSNWIDWNAIIDNKPMSFLYKTESEEHYLYGKFSHDANYDKKSQQSALLCIPGKEAQFQYARADADGIFSFKIHIDEKLKDLIIMPDQGDKNQKIVMESSFSDRYTSHENSSDTARSLIPGFVAKLGINSQVQRIYGNTLTGVQIAPKVQPEVPLRFYGKPEFQLVLADYINLPAMNEIFFELLPDVSLKNKKSGQEISITYHVDDTQVTTLPALMIDGVIIKNASLISSLDPELVEKIDVIKEKYVVGKYIFPGIINVITRTADFSSVAIPDYMTRLPYRVIDPVKNFVSPDYSSDEMKESRIPDYRNTLYWNPNVKTGNKISFWSSDNKGDYLISIEGFTKEGKIISVSKRIKVY